jgi:GTP:adenosylcobinamide-phosphate guanylyltransferase
MRWDIINNLITEHGYKSYLEIGVYNKEWNFNKIKCKTKVGVDPNPTVLATHALTSDAFFAQNKASFDIIFIDGLHHSEQVVKDIENSLSCLSKGGSIVVHDCNPTSKAMQAVPREQGEWTGDVWKAWLHFRERKDLSMKVHDVDYGVGVIQKGEQIPLVVDNPTYEGFEKHKKEWLNLLPYGISICIPAFHQYGNGKAMLTKLLNSLANLTGEHEIIVSDNGHSLKDVCSNYNVEYYHNPVQGISANTNFAISKASYDKIKIIYMDDLCLSNDMVKEFSKALDSHGWAISHSVRLDAKSIKGRPIVPRWTDEIIKGRNTIGMPSVIGFNKVDFEFDTNLKTLLDCEFYWRLYQKYGPPHVITKNLIGQRYWDGSTSRKQGNHTETEYQYLKEKWQLT